MRKQKFLITALILVAAGAIAFGADTPVSGPATSTARKNTMNIGVKVGSKTFTATLEDNATAKAFKALLPVTIRMTELNGNERYFRLSGSLPRNASNPGTIQTGDLMIYGTDTLVLFYDTFPTSYSYTGLGRINNPAGLAVALGSGDVTVTFELQEQAKGN